jgi:hypothetical protein
MRCLIRTPSRSKVKLRKPPNSHTNDFHLRLPPLPCPYNASHALPAMEVPCPPPPFHIPQPSSSAMAPPTLLCGTFHLPARDTELFLASRRAKGLSSGYCRGPTDRGREYLFSTGIGDVVDTSVYRSVYAEELGHVDETRAWDGDISWRPHGWRTGMGR